MGVGADMMEDLRMVDELVFPQDISTEWLFNLLESAYIPCEIDADGALCITEGFKCFVLPSTDGRQLYLRARFSPSHDGKTHDEKTELINRFNETEKMVRVSLDG